MWNADEIKLSNKCFARRTLGDGSLIRVDSEGKGIYFTFDEIKNLYMYALRVLEENHAKSLSDN